MSLLLGLPDKLIGVFNSFPPFVSDTLLCLFGIGLVVLLIKLFS